MSATNPLSFLGGMVLEIGAVIAVVAILFPQGSKAVSSRDYQPQSLPAMEIGFCPVEFQPPSATPLRSTDFWDRREAPSTPFGEPDLRPARSMNDYLPRTTEARAATRELVSDAGNQPPRIARNWQVPAYSEMEVERSSLRTELLRPALYGREYRRDLNQGGSRDYYDRY